MKRLCITLTVGQWQDVKKNVYSTDIRAVTIREGSIFYWQWSSEKIIRLYIILKLEQWKENKAVYSTESGAVTWEEGSIF